MNKYRDISKTPTAMHRRPLHWFWSFVHEPFVEIRDVQDYRLISYDGDDTAIPRGHLFSFAQEYYYVVAYNV